MNSFDLLLLLMYKVASAKMHLPKLPSLDSCIVSKFYEEGCTSCAHGACDRFWIIYACHFGNLYLFL
jgi:hypothetical protein